MLGWSLLAHDRTRAESLLACTLARGGRSELPRARACGVRAELACACARGGQDGAALHMHLWRQGRSSPPARARGGRVELPHTRAHDGRAELACARAHGGRDGAALHAQPWRLGRRSPLCALATAGRSSPVPTPAPAADGAELPGSRSQRLGGVRLRPRPRRRGRAPQRARSQRLGGARPRPCPWWMRRSWPRARARVGPHSGAPCYSSPVRCP